MQPPDMAEFEAEFIEQPEADGHACGVECDHHHAGAHIDHLEENIVGHEATHAHERHVHGAGCGHIEHEQAPEHIDRHHVHDANCGHLPHAEAKMHVDHHDSPREVHAHEHSHSAEHVHGPGCGHVKFEHAHEQADRVQTHEHELAPDIHAAKEGVVADHPFVRAEAVPPQRETEATRLMDIVQERSMHEQVERHSPTEVEAPRAAKRATPVPVETRKIIKQRVEVAELPNISAPEISASEEANERRAEALPTNDLDEAQADIEDNAISLNDTELDAVSNNLTTESGAEEVDVLNTAVDENSVTQEIVVDLVNEVSLDEAVYDTGVDETPEFESAAVSDEVADVVEQLLVPTSVELVEPEFTQVIEVEDHQTVAQEVVPTEMKVREVLPAESLAEALEGIEKQFTEFEKTTVDARQGALDELHRSITNVRASLHENSGEVNLAKVSQDFLRLLTLLSFEKPLETLRMYLERYGIGVLDDLLSRLFELLRQARSKEFLAAVKSLFITDTSDDTTDMHWIGKAVLALLAKPSFDLS
jgi:hypothetical protein